MSVIGTRSFKGEIPRIEPHLLPPTHAQRAVDCDFANGSLKPLQGGFVLRSMANSPVGGIYTEDGINFYTWQAETYAFQSPVIDDTNNRVYYLTPSQGLFKATTKTGMTVSGPTPTASNSWNVGVPRPTVAPVLSIVENRNLTGYPIFPDYPNYSVKVEAWYEDSSNKSYGRAVASHVEVVKAIEYTFTVPARPADVAADVTLRLAAKITFINTDSNTEIMSATVRNGATGRSQSLPGGVEFTLEETGGATSAKITLRWGVSETRAYTYTYINSWLEEGAPAPASTISLTYIQSVQATLTPGVFTGYRPFQRYQIYRTFGASASYLPIEMISPGPIFVDGYRKPFAGGEALQSMNWTPPPTGLQGIDMAPNGWFAAFKGNTLYMSEPFRPHAWPYNMTFPKNIRGIKVGQQSIVVTAADGVYIVAGAHPSAAQQLKLSSPQPGIAQRSMANVDGAVAYASNDGFILVQGTTASPDVSQKLFDRGTWRRMFATQLADASMRMAYHDGALIAVSSNSSIPSTQAQGFLFRMDDDAGSFTRLSARYDSMFMLPVADSLYYAQGAVVSQFRGGDPGTFDWWSGDSIFPMDVTFAIGFLNASGPVRVRIYSNDAVVYDQTVAPGYFRLPSMTKRLKWSVRLEGSVTVREFFIAGSITELKSE